MAREKIVLTPEMAKKFLEHNYKNNRRVRPLAVGKLAEDIQSGRWNPELSKFQDPLLFTKDGTLINGQHRCHAVVESGLSIEIYAEYDVPENIYELLDGATVRMAADFVDVPNRKNATTIAKIMCAIEDGSAPLSSSIQGKLSAKVKATRSQIIQKVNSDNEYIQWLLRSGERAAKYFFNKKNPFAVALLLIDYTGRGDVIERFVSECSQMTTSSQPINALRSYMGRCVTNKNFKSDSAWAISSILYTYEAFRAGTEIRSFNKLNNVFSKYDKYVFETRKKNKEVS